MRLESEIRAYLETQLLGQDQIPYLLDTTHADGRHPNNGWVYDADLGFVHAPATLYGNGVMGTNTRTDYELDGARKLVNCIGSDSRIHTYGDSFTHCDQVNDGETWQEVLASHLQEPIRNYGVGAYSVYQSYLRMKKLRDAGNTAPYVVLNIYEDDHYRNLLWRGLNVSARKLDPPRPKPPFHPFRPYLTVNVGGDTFLEHENIAQDAEDLNMLSDLDSLVSRFGNHPAVQLALAKQNKSRHSLDYLHNAAEILGLTVPEGAEENMGNSVTSVFTEAALFSTIKVLEMVDDFCKRNNIELAIVLSYSSRTILSVLEGVDRFDHCFVQWIKRRGNPVIDMIQAFRSEFEYSTLGAEVFLEPYFIGHHSPAGNAFTARSMMNFVIDWMDPKPFI